VTLRGGCQCGALRYAAAGPVEAVYVCHCLECRRQSASAFGISVQVPAAGLALIQGTPAWWEREADSGRRLRCAFCPRCGSRLWHEGVPLHASLSLKGGSLDSPPDLSAAVHLWTSRRLPGVTIPPGARQFAEEPVP
jgi:hypothetical protein